VARCSSHCCSSLLVIRILTAMLLLILHLFLRVQALLPLQMLVVLIDNMVAGRFPGLGLGPEMFVVVLVLFVQHRFVHLWLAVFLEALIERLVAALEQIQLRIEQIRIAVLVQSSV